MANPIRPTIQSEILALVLVVASFLASLYFYQNFPDQVPTHWNLEGEIDGWSSRAFAAFFFPVLIAGLYVLFFLIPYLDPKKDRYQEFRTAYHVFKNAIVTLLVFIYLLVGISGLGYEIPIELIVPVGIGLLFLVLGKFLPQIKPNWFVGIRTPWTLSNEQVWNKTHSLGGKLFMGFGVLLILSAALPKAFVFTVFIATVIFVALVPIIYSFVLYRKYKRNGGVGQE